MQRIESAICAAKKARPYNALITETFDLARRQANKAIQRGITPFPLVVKDCFALAGFPLTCGSKMLEKFVPPYTSTVVQRLIEKGGCIIGKGNMDEFCMGTSSALGYFGPVKSGFSKVENLEEDWRIPGGSSGGPAVAVQLGVADIGIGSDTGGSTRNPASFNGLFGLKPTYGVCSRFGLVPLVNSMDSPSIFAHTAEDCWKTLRIMAGRDENDSTCFDLPERKQISSLKSLRVGLPKEYHNSSLSVAAWCAWNAAANAFERAGAHLLEVSLPSTEYSLLCYHVLSYVDIASNMARSESLNDVVRQRIFAGNYFAMKENRERFYDHALRVRRKIAYEFQQVFKSVDVLLTPTASDAAPLYSELAESRFEREHSDDFYTQPANLAGVPAISVPFHEKDEDELPVGVQIIGDLLMDRMVIDVAGLLYKELNTVKKERLRYSEQDS